MAFLTKLRRRISQDSVLRVLWHKIEGGIGGIIYGFPSRSIRVIGVTGTNGKTTTAHLIAAVLAAGGKKVGLASTTHFQIGSEQWENTTHQTTLGRFHLHRMLRRMVRAKCQYAVLEISSHALHQGRVVGIAVDCAVLTNVSHEHLDYHRTFEKYVQAKALLFHRLRKTRRKRDVPKISVVNLDSSQWDVVRGPHHDKVEVYGYTLDPNKKAKATEIVSASDIRLEKHQTTFHLHIQNASIEITMPLVGMFNVSNALAAASACYAQGVSLEVIANGLRTFHPVPGRMERIDEGQLFDVYVDFAVTPGGFENIFKLLRSVTQGKVICVFGMAGERDHSTRPIMGELAVTLTDLAVITDDEPYSEDPATIRKEVMRSFVKLQKEKGKDFVEIPDRREAILYAVQKAQPGDAVVITGMGNYEYRMMGGKRVPWDDREVARECLQEMRSEKN